MVKYDVWFKCLVGGALALWLVRYSRDRAIQVRENVSDLDIDFWIESFEKNSYGVLFL